MIVAVAQHDIFNIRGRTQHSGKAAVADRCAQIINIQWVRVDHDQRTIAAQSLQNRAAECADARAIFDEKLAFIPLHRGEHFGDSEVRRRNDRSDHYRVQQEPFKEHTPRAYCTLYAAFYPVRQRFAGKLGAGHAGKGPWLAVTKGGNAAFANLIRLGKPHREQNAQRSQFTPPLDAGRPCRHKSIVKTEQVSQRYIVTGTDTGVGKTIFAAALAAHLGARYWKPVQAGLAGETDSDSVTRLTHSKTLVLEEAYRLNTPCSPHEAARIDGVTINPAELALPRGDRPLVVEGAGGVLVPLTDDLVYADMFAQWGLPLVLVARTTLGTINHSLLSLEALRARAIVVHGVVFSGEPVPASEAAITRIGKVRHLGRLPQLDPLTAETLAAAFAMHIDTRAFA
jgi:dethiobiotin synthetase